MACSMDTEEQKNAGSMEDDQDDIVDVTPVSRKRTRQDGETSTKVVKTDSSENPGEFVAIDESSL